MENSHPVQGGHKTILFADNIPSVLYDVSAFLVKGGYHVLSARTGEDAIRQMNDYKEEIHLLLAAFDMPEMNGLGLAAQVSLKWPDVKVLLMCEFNGGTLILNEGWHFLPNPFVESQLSALILTLITPANAIPRYKEAIAKSVAAVA
jgi:CheY-like chemotaxis protein